MPYSTERSEFRGNPVLVMLCNGQPWGTTYPTDPEFQFGRKKAIMILAIRDLLEDFNRTEGRNAAEILTEIPAVHGLNYPMSVKGSAGFDAPNGHYVDKPYLTLTSGKTKIGLGVNKAQALLHVWPQIERFVTETL